MANAYIVRARTDLPAGAVQVTDLSPNSSHSGTAQHMIGQSGYLPPLRQNDTVVVTANATVAAYNGLAAWLIDTIDDAGDGGALSATEANNASTAIYTALQASLAAGTDFDAAAINTAIQTVVAASGIALGASVGTLLECLRILAGEVYTVPAATGADTGAGNYKGSAAGAFDDDASEDRGYRRIYDTASLQISCGQGVLYNLGLSTFSYYVSGTATAGGAVVVYEPDGTILNT